MLRRPKLLIFKLSRHSWRRYSHTKEIRGHSSPRSPKELQNIVSVHRYDQLLFWHVGKTLWAYCPIRCFNLERRAPKVFWCYQTCDRTWSIVGLTGLQCSVWNTYWCFQTTDWCSHLPKGQSRRFLFNKDEYFPKKLYHDWEITPLHSCISQGVP